MLTLPRTAFSTVLWLLLATLGLQLSGCGALSTSIKKRNLDVQTKMSDTVFLDPVAPSKRIVFVDIRNTTDTELPVQAQVLEQFRKRGYTITDDPDKANFMLQANILQIGKSDLRSKDSWLGAGFGGALVGAGVGTVASNASRDVAAAALIGAAAGVISDALVDDVLYTMVTDLQIRERPQHSEVVTQSQETQTSQGSSTETTQKVNESTSDWKTYRTRVVSTANKANLTFDEAREPLVDGLIHSIGGIF